MRERCPISPGSWKAASWATLPLYRRWWSPLLWTSVATGQYADRHRILDVAEPDPVTGGIRPVTRASLCAPQMWDILTREGFRCQTVGWPATHPAEGPVTCVSDRALYGEKGGFTRLTWKPPCGRCVSDPREWTGAELELFVPGLAQIDQDRDRRLAKLAMLLADDLSVHAGATLLLETREWDFAAVWFGAVSRATALFPPGTEEVYQDVVSGVYRYLDLFLGRLVQLAGPDAIVVLVSDRASGEPEAGIIGRGASGMICAAGPGIHPDELTLGCGLLDIAPTVLGLFGLAAEGMPGRVIPEICPVRSRRAVIVEPAKVRVKGPEPELEAHLAELEDLGYTDLIAASWRTESEVAGRRRDFHLGRVLLAQDRAEEAIPLLESVASVGAGYEEAQRHPGSRLLPGRPYLPTPGALPVSAGGCPGFAVCAADVGSTRHLRRQLRGSASPSGGGSNGLWHGGRAGCIRRRGLSEAESPRGGDRSVSFGIATDSALAAAHEGLARALFASGNPKEAAEAALDAVRLRYDSAPAHAVLGQSPKALGRDEDAARALAVSDALNRQTATR